MTPNEVTAILRLHLNWRRDTSNWPPSPTLVEKAIDAAVEMIERLEAAESECLEQDRLNGMGSEREAALMAKLEAAKKDRANFLVEMGRLCAQCDALRAKIEAMEKQEPVAWLHESRRDSDVVTSAVKHVWGKVAVGSLAAYSIPLYLAPGAKGEEK